MSLWDVGTGKEYYSLVLGTKAHHFFCHNFCLQRLTNQTYHTIIHLDFSLSLIDRMLSQLTALDRMDKVTEIFTTAIESVKPLQMVQNSLRFCPQTKTLQVSVNLFTNL